MISILTVALAFVVLTASARVQPPLPDLVLTGTIDASAHQTYREIPFRVPPGITAIAVDFNYTEQEQRTVIDLGLADPQRFRGWSGGSKARFTLSESFATPSYLPGPIVSGVWKLVLGVPNIRKGVRSDYTARIRFTRAGAPPQGFAAGPLAAESRWYRGDFHAHSGHSDGTCASASGKRVPCPLHKSVEAAAARGLDFVALSEHNATAQHQALAELQPFHDTLLLLPARELTTFVGHANMFGPVEPVDFRVGTKAVPTVNVMLARVAALGGLISVNHPSLPSGEACMGCGWTAADTDWSRVQDMEVVNGGAVAIAGGAVETPLSGIAFWEALLNQGHRLTAIGGSDNHDVSRDANTVGMPTTVVFARDLSVSALLDGVRSARVFIDVDGTRDRLLELSAKSDAATMEMGGTLPVRPGSVIELTVRVAGVPGGRIEAVRNGKVIDAGLDGALRSLNETRRFTLVADPATRWVRINVRDVTGRLVLIGNPVFFTPAPDANRLRRHGLRDPAPRFAGAGCDGARARERRSAASCGGENRRRHRERERRQ